MLRLYRTNTDNKNTFHLQSYRREIYVVLGRIPCAATIICRQWSFPKRLTERPLRRKSRYGSNSTSATAQVLHFSKNAVFVFGMNTSYRIGNKLMCGKMAADDNVLIIGTSIICFTVFRQAECKTRHDKLTPLHDYGNRKLETYLTYVNNSYHASDLPWTLLKS